MAETYDLVVIGAGPAGYTAAQESAKRGRKTALVENRALGGTCLNRGCIPTKTILHSSGLYARMKEGGNSGIYAKELRFDMAQLQEHKEEVIRQLRSGILSLMKKGKVAVYEGTGTILTPHQVLVHGAAENAAEDHGDKDEKSDADRMPKMPNEGIVLEAEHILIATGSVPAALPVPGADLPDVVNSDQLLSKKALYPRLTIVGGGVIGMEFASIYSDFGCRVTVIEFLDRILANMDREISQNLKMILKKRGVEIHTGARVEEILRKEDGTLLCRYREKDLVNEAESDGILMAVGRRTCTQGLLSEGMELAMERGRIVVNEDGRTSVPNIYAAGDVTGGIQLAHAASAQAIRAVAHMNGEESTLCDEWIPACVYTNPEIGTIGLSQDEAKEKHIPVMVRKYPMSANAKTVLTGQERGFIKVVADPDTHKILGAQMMCARATDLISEFGTAVVNGLTLEQMARAVRPHPTFGEAIGEAVRI